MTYHCEANNDELVVPPTRDIEQKVVDADHLPSCVLGLARVDAIVNGCDTCQLQATPWKLQSVARK